MLLRSCIDRILGNDGCQLACRLDDDWHLDLEFAGDRGSNGLRVLRRRVPWSAEDGIAAVEQRSHAGVAQAREQGTQLGHGNTLRPADVDTAKQGYECG